MLDRLLPLSFRRWMAFRRAPRRITATLTIEGDAAEVLAELRKLRGLTRRVVVAVEVPDPAQPRLGTYPHSLPTIQNGETSNAIRSLQPLANQARIDSDEEERIRDLIEQFGPLT